MSPKKSLHYPLKNKWIVVTRPIHQTKAIKTQLEKAGANVILFPLLEITEPKNLELARMQLSNIGIYDLVIFVSPNAVEQSVKWLDIDKLKNESIIIASIGKKTAAALAQFGLESNICPNEPFNSEAFLALPEIQSIGSPNNPIKKIAIIRGEGGRNLLYDSLVRQGAKVDHIDSYKRICPQQTDTKLKQHWINGELDTILLTSSTSIKNLFHLTENQEWINQVNLLIGSQRMKQQIPDVFSGNLLIADNPSDETLFDKLVNPDNDNSNG